MNLVIHPSGEVTTIYSEVLDLAELGRRQIARASYVEPDRIGNWWAEIIDGPRLGPFNLRSQALEAEVKWLLKHRLGIADPE
ncbi:hypothetical protein [Schlesneria paludicola]|uniref:hypothetical protein n=1 Tax=Schlesneria paludicola TaxID=360056 RepID=UPI00029AD221|nr:hypothetical protein [Schlesneria paludicola]